MRIAHIDTGRDWRGGQAHVLLLLRGLRERGHDVVLVAPDAPLAERAREAGIEWRPLRTGGDLDLGAGRRLAGALAGWRPSVLHAHTARAHTLARAVGPRLRAAVVVSRRVLAPIGRNPFSRRKYLHGVARYLCISRAVVDVLARGGVEASRLALVPSAVDVATLAAIRDRVARGTVEPELRAMIGAAADDEVIGAVGALTREKGASVFAAAAAEVLATRPAAWAVWIGEGPERARLERTAERLGFASRVRVLGFRRDVHTLVAQLSLFVSSSVHEGLGTAVLEAQALGVAVVATDSGGVRDSVEDGKSGRVIGDPEALGGAVIEALGDRAALARWRDAGLVSVTRFAPERMVESTLAQYASAQAEFAGPQVD